MSAKVKIKLASIIWAIILIVFGLLAIAMFILYLIFNNFGKGNITANIGICIFPLVGLFFLGSSYISFRQEIIFDYQKRIILIHRIKKAIINFKDLESFALHDRKYVSRYSDTPRNYLDIVTTIKSIRVNLTYASINKKRYKVIQEQIRQEFKKALEIKKQLVFDQQNYSFKK